MNPSLQSTQQPTHQDGQAHFDPIGMDVFSADGKLIGRISGFAGAPQGDQTEGLDRTAMDTDPWQTPFAQAQRVRIDGGGYIIQARIAVPISQIDFDLRGRRATLRLTLAQIEQIPHHNPNAGAVPPA